MESGFGTTVTLIIAGVLWLVYLVPALRRNREFEATEKNAIRIQQALRAFAQSTETPDEIVTELSNREALIRQRERERIERERDRALRAQVRAEAHVDDPAAAARQRSVKLGLTALALVSAVTTGIFGFAGEWLPTILSLGVLGLSAVALVVINGSRVEVRTETRARRFTGLPEVDETWTPVRTPKVHRSLPEGAGLIVTPETERKVEEAERAARIREQAARVAAQAEPTIDPRFTELGLPTEEVPMVDINAALRARRAQ
jgi:hypothetical protein